MQSTIILSLIAGVLAGGVAIAQSTETAKPRYVAKFDARFKAADRDGDGGLNRSEAQAAGLNRVVERFDHIDADHDGKVTMGELRNYLARRVSS